MVRAAIEIPEDKITDFCLRNHITKMALFGSVLRNDFTSNSDVDVLVEFHPEHVPGLYFFSIQDELSDILRRKVDLVTFRGLSKYIRKRVMEEAKTVYVRA